MTMDISIFYLNSPLPRPEFIKIKLSNIPEEIINEYNLREKATPSGSVYIMAFKGMYGLPQAKLIANELLESRLNKHGCPFTLNALNLRVLPPLKAQKSHLLGTDKE
jgi:hypothetical protein